MPNILSALMLETTTSSIGFWGELSWAFCFRDKFRPVLECELSVDRERISLMYEQAFSDIHQDIKVTMYLVAVSLGGAR